MSTECPMPFLELVDEVSRPYVDVDLLNFLPRLNDVLQLINKHIETLLFKSAIRRLNHVTIAC